MYTQCPECSVAFRVTAEVLKQAAGKVRCGGCGNAFNALAHLSEEKPGSAAKPEASGVPEPELTPELPADKGTGTRPKAISAEQSAALLKTLDELAGEDIRIEDTGVEWRVLNEDEVLDDDDSPSVVDTRQESIIDQLESIADGSETAEMRFDDNTPLPDDFGLDDEAAVPPPPQPEVPEPEEPPPDPTAAQADLAFGEPDEWEDLLGEVGDAEAENVGGRELSDVGQDAAIEALADEEQASEPRADAEPEPDAPADKDVPLDMDTQFQLQAEAMGVDISGIHSTADEEIELEADEEIDKADTSIEEDLIAAAFEAEAEARKEVSAAEEMLEEFADDGEIDIEAQLAELEAYAPAAADEQEPDVDVLEFEEPGDVDDEIELIDDLHVEQELAIEAELKAAEAAAAGYSEPEPEPELEPEPEPTLETEPDPETGEHEVSEMSDEELTINRMIDQDLLAIAVEDDDGFTSTIVQKQVSDDDHSPKTKKKPKKDKNKKGKKKDKGEAAKDDDKPELAATDPLAAAAAGGLVETIIMEGESIRGEVDEAKEAEKASFMAEARSNIASLKKADDGEGQPLSIGMIAGIVVLVLILIGQFIHQRRESLATIPAFNNSIGSIYRGIGQPVTPQWNVSGWRFEATKGDIGDGEELLTIYSRIGNNSDDALPYPLIHVALTDRFEEIIGSTVLEPAEYLAGDPDPRKAVPSGNTFDAAISIESPSPEATGFRLDVCYRLAGGQLRCAIEDFK